MKKLIYLIYNFKINISNYIKKNENNLINSNLNL